MDIIKSAFNDLEKYTCIRFVYKTNHEDYVHIFKGEGCYSYVGKIGGRQKLSLDDGCIDRGTIQHEIIHALGYTHMQNHADRDKYIRILWNNIEPKHHHNFEKVQSWEYGNFNTAYDFKSVMHYENGAFSSNNRDTIVPTQKYMAWKDYLSHTRKLTQGDADRLNNMYKCDN